MRISLRHWNPFRPLTPWNPEARLASPHPALVRRRANGEKEAEMRRSVLVGLIVLTALLVAVVPADAESELVDRYHQLDGTGHVKLTEDGRTIVGDIVGSEVIVNASGDVIDKLAFRARAGAPGRFMAQGMTDAPCVHDTSREGFTAYLPPFTYAIDDKNEKGLFQYHMYSQDNARTNAYGDPTVQFLGCAVGGVDSDNGSRIIVSGPGLAFSDPDRSYILGTKWREGKTPEDYSITLGFEVPATAVKVTGSITQNPTNFLKGSVAPPYGHSMRDFHENATNAWWEDGCKPRCTRFGGSNGYQGSVAEGLWEFPQTAKHLVLDIGFEYAAYVEHFCSNPLGC
jgi:hypothetical protein